ncbi:MAG: DNA mismatch repair protein MutS [Clostridia bacterium]|nr:DNA mismatch repair protein MutS [Clostridia bacterium]
MDYVKMIFHVDIIKFYSMLEVLKKNQDAIKDVYEVIGRIDTCIAIASYRESLEYWSEPKLKNSNSIEYKVEEVYHPLISKAVSNSISEKKSVLLTGSNASGKSTFIKTLAINAILSQTIYTSASRSYEAPFYQIYTSMALRDDLISGESYYMVEIKSLKRIITAKHEDRPILCFVDEVLRGTNTLERISASAHILTHIAHDKAMCFAATHDIELTKILSKDYKNYHFQEKIMDNDVKFDYKLYDGETKSRNAIKLLKMIGYSDEIVDKASNMANNFLESGNWVL